MAGNKIGSDAVNDRHSYKRDIKKVILRKKSPPNLQQVKQTLDTQLAAAQEYSLEVEKDWKKHGSIREAVDAVKESKKQVQTLQQLDDYADHKINRAPDPDNVQTVEQEPHTQPQQETESQSTTQEAQNESQPQETVYTEPQSQYQSESETAQEMAEQRERQQPQSLMGKLKQSMTTQEEVPAEEAQSQ